MVGILLESLKNTTYVLCSSVFHMFFLDSSACCLFVASQCSRFVHEKCAHIKNTQCNLAPMMFISTFVLNQIEAVIPSFYAYKAMKVIIVTYMHLHL